MILNPRFYGYDRVDRRREQQRLGLDPSLVTGLVLFGGQGSPTMIEIDRRLDEAGLNIQLILLCGKNESLARALRARKSRRPRVIEEFTRNVPYYMQLADFFVGKPGPGSIAEAMAMGLPVIVEKNAWTLPQERYNADWVRDRQVGLVVKNFAGIGQAVSHMLEPGRLSLFRRNVADIENRALFEIPEILEVILADRLRHETSSHRTTHLRSGRALI
jgi:1,2-diacylglycerol 3-beta-galactosyltransferase